MAQTVRSPGSIGVGCAEALVTNTPVLYGSLPIGGATRLLNRQCQCGAPGIQRIRSLELELIELYAAGGQCGVDRFSEVGNTPDFRPAEVTCAPPVPGLAHMSSERETTVRRMEAPV